MSGLAVAVFAAEAGEHVVDAPRGRRFELFRRSFDEAAYRRRLDAAALVGRPRRRAVSAATAAIHDPPPGLFARTLEPPDLGTRPTVAIVGARACSAYGSNVAHGWRASSLRPAS